MASMDVVKTAMMQMLNADEINTIKQEAYSRGILVDDIMSIFGVLLRDRILNKKGLPVSDVDVYAKQ
jgi:hypothetical protein